MCTGIPKKEQSEGEASEQAEDPGEDIDEAATFALVDPGKGVDEVTVINIDVEALQRCAKQDLFKHLETWVHRGYHLEQDLPLPGADAKEKSFFACSCDKFGVGN